jgi:hypothetical protein
VGAQFYPYYALAGNSNQMGYSEGCALLFGNFSGGGVNNFGRDEQYGASNLPWFFGQNSSGPQVNPCTPQTD